MFIMAENDILMCKYGVCVCVHARVWWACGGRVCSVYVYVCVCAHSALLNEY